jgi:molecular chaperone DnaK (HSP70)
MSKVIGTDLDTINSCASVMDARALKVIENTVRVRMTPSIVAFTDSD